MANKLSNLNPRGYPSPNLIDNVVSNLNASYGEASVQMTTTKSGAFASTWKGSGTIWVDWGDGSALEDFVLTGGGTAVGHTYADGTEKTIIVTGDLSGVTSLVADSQSISAVTGMRYLSACTFCTFYFNSITSTSGFSGMASIVELGLAFNSGLADLSGLSGLMTLNNLSLHACNISDLSPLSTLIPLKYLRLYSNAFSDISPLTSLTDLATGLQIYNNSITYTTLTWPSYSAGVQRWDSANLDSGELDTALNDAYSDSWSEMEWYLDGSNGTRTSASDMAVAMLALANVILHLN